MILIACTSCYFTMRVEGDREEVDTLVGPRSDFWPDHYACPECQKPAVGMLERDVEASALHKLRILDVAPMEAFAALHELGLPVEQQCSLDIVRDLLRQHPVRRVVGQNTSGTQRCVLDYLELWDGSRVYLGPSPNGAVVYRITRPHSYADAVRQ